MAYRLATIICLYCNFSDIQLMKFEMKTFRKHRILSHHNLIHLQFSKEHMYLKSKGMRQVTNTFLVTILMIISFLYMLKINTFKIVSLNFIHILCCQVRFF